MRTIPKNDRVAHIVIIGLSIIVFTLVSLMRKVKFSFDFDTHIFPLISACLNTLVAILLVLGLIAVKKRKLELHKKIMMTAVITSILFLVSYVLYHFTTVEASYAGDYKLIYYFILATHIVLAGVILPFILYAVYRGLTGEYEKHKKLTKFVWPIWFYVSVTGVVVYLMISPFY